MTREPSGRYPTFTRQHLEPIEAFRATILLRDHGCLAAGLSLTGRYWAGVLPCSDELAVVSAAPCEQPDPIYLRTFCSSHLALALPRTPALRQTWLEFGWRIPDVVDPAGYAAVLPVRTIDAWWLLDSWGERRQIDDEEATTLRSACERRWLS